MGIKIEGNISEGIFVVRENRFRAKINIDGKEYYAHVPNTGRMAELLKPGAKVLVRKSYDKNRVTEYDLLMVYKENLLICIDSRLPNELVFNEIKNGSIKGFAGYDNYKREVGYKNSRFDIYLSGNLGRMLIEVKCVTLFKNKLSMFPDAPTERGRKHITELMDAKKNGINCALIFVVFSNDVDFFTPNDSMDPEFGRLLRKAYLDGIPIHAYSCEISPKYLELKDRLYLII